MTHITEQAKNMLFNLYDDLESEHFDKIEFIQEFTKVLQQLGIWEEYQEENNVIFNKDYL